ncbi:MAG: methyltransferase [Candidatus Dormibacteraeota bacterium]|nr:methyltransferase [Candidatus Dormibacteraeota bacterium]
MRRSCGSVSENRCVSQHYFSPEPEVASRPATVQLRVDGRTVELTTDRGVFAHGIVDRGTDILLRTIPPPPPRGHLLDLGSGYGPIAVSVALRSPSAAVWAVDVNRRARELTARNAATLGATNVRAVAPDEVPPSLRFAAVYCNPPVRLGKQPLHELLKQWLERLEPNAAAFLVVQRHLGADTLAGWLTREGLTQRRVRSRQGYRVIEVRLPPASAHDGA